MEYSQTEAILVRYNRAKGLNPYSNGILTDKTRKDIMKNNKCLNPYSNGILTDTLGYCLQCFQKNRLNPYSNGILTDLSK